MVGLEQPGGLKVILFMPCINRQGGLKAMHACTITSRCVCVFVVGVCVCLWSVCVCVFLVVCLLVVSNASMIDLLLLTFFVVKLGTGLEG